jgi:hypothetical protein
MHRRILLLPAMLFAVLAPLAAEPIGKIVYLAGTVEIVRDEDTLAAKTVREGFALENFDLLLTGGDGEIELLVSTPAVPATTIRVGPRTQFSLEIGKVGAKQQTTIDLVAGSVALKCAKLTGSQAVKVLTEGAAMGVRGTSFTVNAPESGDLLVTCDEGEVELTADDGSTLSAVAGEAVERRRGAKLARIALAGVALGQARQAWLAERTAAWQRDPLTYLRLFAAVYDLQLGRFNRKFDQVVKSRKDIFDAWRQESRAGIVGRLIAALKEGAQLKKDVRELRAALFRLERTFVRLDRLRDYCVEQDISGRIGLFRSTKTLFARLDRERDRFEKRRGAVRWFAGQFAQRNDGEVPLGADGQ